MWVWWNSTINNTTITPSTTPTTPSSSTSNIESNDSTELKIDNIKGSSLNIINKVKGRYIKLLKNNGIINISEIQVSSNGVNVALNKPVIATSKSHGRNPNLLTNGNTNGNWNSGNVFHTQNTKSNIILIDLENKFDIDEIRIFNRSDCCEDRLNNCIIGIFDDDNFDKENMMPSSTYNTLEKFTVKLQDINNPFARYENKIYRLNFSKQICIGNIFDILCR